MWGSIRTWLACTLLALGSVTMASAQGVRAAKINEVLVSNTNNLIDEYGQHTPWIEIYNPTAATIDLSGCYLTNDLQNLKKYPIPKGDIHTKIAPRQYLLFYADALPSRGTFHTSFTLQPDAANFIALVANDGRTIIDSVSVPAALPVDASYARIPDGAVLSKYPNAWQIDTDKVTPASNNEIIDPNAKIEQLQQNDPYGVVMTVISMLVVFLGLLALYLAFFYISKLTIWASKKRVKKSVQEGKGVVNEGKSGIIDGEVAAAIAMAIHQLSSDVHDEEYDIITLREQNKRYSPWSSKIYGLRTPLQRNIRR